MHKNTRSRREVERQRRRRRENTRFAQILKVFKYFQRTGRWLPHTQLQWHHPRHRGSHGECVAQCYRDSRKRLMQEIERCEVVTVWEHRWLHGHASRNTTSIGLMRLAPNQIP